MVPMRGLLIAVEGCDRSGKTTQCKLLVEWVKQQLESTCEYVKFPERATAIGHIINEYLAGKAHLPDQAIHLLFSANRWELRDKMIETLQGGTNLILDRYAISGVAYSVAKGLDLAWCKAPDHGLPRPDLVIFLDVPDEGAACRDGYGQERYEQVDFQLKVRTAYEQLQDDTWIFVDGTGTIEQVHAKVRAAIKDRLLTTKKHAGPLKSLAWK